MIAGVAALTAGALELRLASQAGGYFPDVRLQAGAIAFAVLAVALAVHPSHTRLSGPALLALAGLAGLTVWTGLSAGWSSAPDVALDDFQRDLLYLGVLGLGLVAAGSGRFSRQLIWLVLVTATAILVAALVRRLYPDAGLDVIEAASLYRLGGSLSYWNALGALGAMVVVLGAGLGADTRSHPLLRGLAVVAVVMAGTAAYLSFSRGAWLAFFAGVAVLLLLSPRRLPLLVTLAICGGALALILVRVQSLDALTGDPALGDGRAAEGREFAPVLLALALAAGATQAVVGWLRPHPEAAERLAFLGRRAAAAIGIVAVAAAGVVYLTHTDRAEGTAAARLESADSWVSRQWRDFMNPTTFAEQGAERLTSARGTRSDLFRVAIDGFDTHPLRGDGSGGFEVRFAHDRRVPETVRDVHSLYLETLGELGAVGVAALLALIGAFVWAAVVARLRPRSMSRAPAAAASAGLMVWAAHCIVDWDWQMPAVTVPALLLAAALLPSGIASSRPPVDRGFR